MTKDDFFHKILDIFTKKINKIFMTISKDSFNIFCSDISAEAIPALKQLLTNISKFLLKPLQLHLPEFLSKFTSSIHQFSVRSFLDILKELESGFKLNNGTNTSIILHLEGIIFASKQLENISDFEFDL